MKAVAAGQMCDYLPRRGSPERNLCYQLRDNIITKYRFRN